MDKNEKKPVPSKQELVEVVNNINQQGGSLTDLRKAVGAKFGRGETTVRKWFAEMGVHPILNGENVWHVNQKAQTKRNGDGFDMVDETLKIVEMVDNGMSFEKIGAKLKRHPGEVGRKYRLGCLMSKYASVKTLVESGKISSGRLFQIQRATRAFEKESSPEAGYKLQYQIVTELQKAVKADKDAKGYVRNNHYEHLKTVATLPQEVVSALVKIVGA